MAPRNSETFGMVRGTCPKCGKARQLLKLETGIDSETGKVVHRISCMSTACGYSVVTDQDGLEDFLAGKGDTELL